MPVFVQRDGLNDTIREFGTVDAAAAWIIRLFTEHNWDAPREVIMRSLEPDATTEEKAAARRLWPGYDPADWCICDEQKQLHRVQRDGTVTIDADTDRAIQGEAEGEGAVDDTGDSTRDSGADTSEDGQGDPEG